MLQLQLGEVRAAFHATDHDAAHGGTETEHDLLDQIVRHGPVTRYGLQLHDDGLGLGLSDPDRQHPGSMQLAQHDHERVCGAVHAESRHAHLYHGQFLLECIWSPMCARTHATGGCACTSGSAKCGLQFLRLVHTFPCERIVQP